MRRTLLVLCWALILPYAVHAQWVKTASSLFNSSIGFGGSITFKAGKVWAGTTQLYRSLDSGSTWIPVTSLVLSGTIVNIDFFDANNGLVVTYGGGAYQTTDGGATWAQTLSQGSCLSGTFGATKDVIVVVGRQGFAGHIYVSTDGGTNWTDNVVENGGGAYHVATHRSGRIFVLARNVSPTRSSYVYVSTNNGVTWIKGGLQMDLDTYSFTFGGCSGDHLFLCNEAYNEPGDSRSEIIRADLNGGNPSLVYSDTQAELTGGGTYSGKAIFFQKAATGEGILCSTNDGLNWISIGGPHALWDTRLICAINQNLILAIALDGSVWRTDNCGGFPITTDVPRLSFSPPSELKVSVCDSGMIRTNVQIQASCSDQQLHITSETFSGVHAQLFSLVSQQPPFIIHSNSPSTIAVEFTPNDTGSFSAVLHLEGHYIDLNGNTIFFDTTIALLVDVIPSAPEFSANTNSIQFGTRTPCDKPADTTVTLTNTGCDTLLLFGPVTLPAGFKVDLLQFPILLAPGSSIDVQFLFTPATPGNYSMNATFVGESNGLRRTVYIGLTGSFSGTATQLDAKESTVAFQSLSSCDLPSDTTIVLTNIGCDTLTIIAGPGVLAPGFTIDPLSFPIVLAPGQSISIVVHFSPEGVGGFTTTAIYTSDIGGDSIDFRLDLSGNGLAVPPELSASITSHDFGLVSTCDKPKDTTITLRNDGCDTLIITSASQLPPEFLLVGVMFPIVLPPDSVVTIDVQFFPTGDGPFSTLLQLYCESNGLNDSVSFTLDGAGSEGKGILSVVPQSHQFAPLPICFTDSLDGSITNTGCDTLIIDEAILTGNADFVSSSFSLPYALAPGQALQYTIYLIPQSKGTRNSQLTIRAHTAHGSQTISTQVITVGGFVNDGSRTLSATPDKVEFATTTVCESLDSIISLVNQGCDSLIITAADIIGTGFMIDENFPIIIPPNSQREIVVRTVLDTADGVLMNIASITFMSNAEDSLPPLVLSRGYVYKKEYRIELIAREELGTSGDRVYFDLRVDKELDNVTSLDIDFAYDSDLLTFYAVQSVNAMTFVDGHVRLTGMPIRSENGVIGSLIFTVYLTKDSVSDLRLTNMKFNDGNTYFENCVASVSGIGSDFLYRFNCGERMLSRYMARMPVFSLVSLSPNPARGEVEVIVDAHAPSDIEFMIHDAIGKKVSSAYRSIARGRETVLLDVSTLGSGIYYVEARSGTTRRSISFFKTD